MISQCCVCGAVFAPKKGNPELNFRDSISRGCRLCGKHNWQQIPSEWEHLPKHKGYYRPHKINLLWKSLANQEKLLSDTTKSLEDAHH